MDAFLTSVSLVGLGEIGDKTQLLALVLAARFCKAGPVIAGITLATLLNHALAATFGHFVGSGISALYLHMILACFFIGTGLFGLLHPDAAGAAHTPGMKGRGAFAASLITFFLAEMGDKTQIVTLALGARFPDTHMVVLGTTAGMLLADIPAVLAGKALNHRLPMDALRYAAAALFIGMGLWEIAGIFTMRS